MDTVVPPGRGGMGGYSLSGFSSPHFAFLARQIMDTDGPVVHAEMERGRLFYSQPSRRIVLEQRPSDLRVTLEGSVQGIHSLTRIVNQMFLPNLESQHAAEAIAKFLTQ